MDELDLFAAAIAVADPEERAALVERECAGRPALRERLDQLLAAHFRPHSVPDQAEAEYSHALTGWASATESVRTVTEAVGTIVAGRYKLLQQIGEGGMGSVWMADQTQPVKRRVAVKLIRVERGQSRMILSRFEAERQAIALMDHPHIAKLLDAGTTAEGSPFFVMELVKGIPLNEYCDAHKLGIRDRLQLFMQVCSAVQHAHQKGIIHRDLKPSNILVESHDAKPVPKVIDFGLAKATSGIQLSENTLFTAFGSIIGTPLYMAPEQANFNAIDVDTRADVYALGVILYELLTGTTPITRESLKQAALDEMLKLIREQDTPTPSSRLSTVESAPSIAANRQMEPQKLSRFVKGELDWIVMKALSKERDRRYETATGFARDIERFLNDEAVAAGPPSAWYKLRKLVHRNRVQVIAASLVLLALVLGVVGTTLGLLEARRQAAIASGKEREANEEKKKALLAADAERNAKLEAEQKRQEAERNLAFAKKGNEILRSVFAGLDPKRIAESGRPLQDLLRQNLATAVRELEGSAIGDPLEVAGMQITLGQSLLGLGEASLAAEVFQKALETLKARLGPNHPVTLTSLNEQALAYQYSGQLDKAVALFEEALEGEKAKLGPDHHKTLVSMNNLAVAYQGTGQLAKAGPLFKETLEKMKAKLGPDHPDTLQTMNNLGEAYKASGQPAKAVPLFEELFAKRKAKRGPDHPNTLIAMNNLAGAYYQSGQLARAVPLYEETLEKSKTQLGPDHPSTLTSMNNLATVYGATGQFAKAVALEEDTLEKRKAKLGPEHPDTLTSMNNLASAYYQCGQLAKAVPLYEETLEKMRAKLGPDHPDTLTSMDNLATVYGASGQLAKAVAIHEETLEKRKATLGPDHPDTLASMNNLGKAYVEARRGKDASTTLLAFVQGSRKQVPQDSPQFAGLLAKASLSLLDCGQHAVAERLLRECLVIRETREPDAWATFNTQSLLGGALLGQKKYGDAEPLLVKGYEGMKAREKTIPSPGGSRIPESLDRLIELYTATAKSDQAKKYRELRAKYLETKPANQK
jgi:tetratricopeptide (TPR) repeat protein/tRNA A-37 threonylcarbamoyl transferase component Bud32